MQAPILSYSGDVYYTYNKNNNNAMCIIVRVFIAYIAGTVRICRR